MFQHYSYLLTPFKTFLQHFSKKNINLHFFKLLLFKNGEAFCVANKHFSKANFSIILIE